MARLAQRRQAGRDGLLENGIEGCAQGLVLRPPLAHLFGDIGVLGQPALDQGVPGGVELAVGIGMQHRFVDDDRRAGIVAALAHFTLHRPIRALGRVISRKRARARDRRDITVPTGTPSRVATSS